MNAYSARIAQLSTLIANFDQHREVYTMNPRRGNLMREAAGAAAAAAYVLVKSGIPAANYLPLLDAIRGALLTYRIDVVTKDVLDKIVARDGYLEGCYTVDLDLSFGEGELKGIVRDLNYGTCSAVKLVIDKMPPDGMVPIDRAVMYLAIKYGLVFYRVCVVRQHLVSLLGGSIGIKAIRKRFLEKIFMAMGQDQMFGFEASAPTNPAPETASAAGLFLLVFANQTAKPLIALATPTLEHQTLSGVAT